MEIDRFVKYLEQERRYSSLTAVSYGTDLKQFEAFWLKDNNQDTSDRAIDSKVIRAWIMMLHEQNISFRSINRKISALRAYFHWLERFDTMLDNPMEKIDSIKTSQRKILSISNDDMQLLLGQPYNENDFIELRNHLILVFLYATGVRRSELLSLNESSLNFEDKSFKVMGKRRKERIVPLEDKLTLLLIKYIDMKKRLHIKQQALWVDEKGKPMTVGQLYYMVHNKLIATNVSERSPHIFRHSCATDLINNGADIVNVKNLLGHSSLASTEVYYHSTIEQLKKEYKSSFEHKLDK